MHSKVMQHVRGVRWSAIAGVVGPFWFWLTLMVLALLHGRIDVSGHQLLPFGFLMYVGFLAYGLLTVVFVWGLRQRMPVQRTSTAAIIALTVFAGGPLLATFTMGPEQGPPQSWHAGLHLVGFLIVSLIPIIAMPLFGCAVWREAGWRPLGPVSVAWGVVVAVVVFLPNSPAEGYALWSGPGSMMEIALIGGWQIVVSRRLARLAGQPLPGPETASTSAADNAVS